MEYLKNYQDLGIILSPSQPGEPFYPVDGGGIREAVINRDGDTYYLFYDGAQPGAASDSYWTACLAESKDLIHWTKLGRVLDVTRPSPDNPKPLAMDTKTASSPWVFYSQGIWHMYYVSSRSCSPEGIPACPYITSHATAPSIKGPWTKTNSLPGKEKYVSFMTTPGSWMGFTASPGHIVENPAWKGENDTQNYRYLMFFSGASEEPIKRSISIAGTNDLSAADDYDKKDGNFWHVYPDPILPPAIDLENASLYYEPACGCWFLFTNHVKDNSYTDASYVYCSEDLFCWDPSRCRILVDGTNNDWAHGAIGLPTVVKKDDSTLAVVYDAVEGEGTGHLNRQIALGTIKLPLEKF